jgi:hypothetical protein
MGRRKRRVSAHDGGEETLCDECLLAGRLLARVRELHDQYRLEGNALLRALLQSLQDEAVLEKMWRRRGRRAQ